MKVTHQPCHHAHIMDMSSHVTSSDLSIPRPEFHRQLSALVSGDPRPRKLKDFWFWSQSGNGPGPSSYSDDAATGDDGTTHKKKTGPLEQWHRQGVVIIVEQDVASSKCWRGGEVAEIGRKGWKRCESRSRVRVRGWGCLRGKIAAGKATVGWQLPVWSIFSIWYPANRIFQDIASGGVSSRSLRATSDKFIRFGLV